MFAGSQFGNMLVLAATYQHEKLRCYVPRDKLVSLLDRTIASLSQLGAISQTCKADCWILRRIRDRMFPAVDPSSNVNGINPLTPTEREGSCGSEIVVASQSYAPSVGSSQSWQSIKYPYEPSET